MITTVIVHMQWSPITISAAILYDRNNWLLSRVCWFQTGQTFSFARLISEVNEKDDNAAEIARTISDLVFKFMSGK